MRVVTWGVPRGFPARLTGSLTRVVPGKKLHRGDLVRVVVFGTVKSHSRRTGTSVSLGYNGALSLRKDGSPVAGKLFCPIWLEARWRGYSRVTLLARFLL